MTSCVGETLHDWDIRTEPGDGGDIRPEKGGDPLSLFRHGRVKSSSSAELREELPKPDACACTHVRSRGPSQTGHKHLPDSGGNRFASGRVEYCQMSGRKEDEDASGATEGDRGVPRCLGGSNSATRSGKMQREKYYGLRGCAETACSREGR